MYLVLILFALLCYGLVSILIPKSATNRLRKVIFTTIILWIFGFVGIIYWLNVSSECEACKETISISQLVGKWKTEYHIYEIRNDESYSKTWLSDPKLVTNGKLEIEGAFLKFNSDGKTDEMLEVCEIRNDKIFYHDFSGISLGNGNKHKNEAIRIK